MAARKARITKRTVDATTAPEVGELRIWDTDIRGFHLRVRPTKKVYALRYRIGSVQRTFTIGDHGSPWAPDTARERAEEALRAVARGEDPAVEKQRFREALTVNQLIDTYLADGPATKPAKRASSWENDHSNLNRHIRPLMGRRMAEHVTKAEAAAAVRDITTGKTARTEKSEKKRGRIIVRGGEGVARRTRTAAAAMFKWGIEHGHVKANPFASVKLAAAPMRERFLSREEAGRILDAITSLEAEKALSRTFGDAIRLLLLSGARKTEILGLRWSEVDFDRKSLVLPPERTKAGGKTGERRIILSPPALTILEARRRDAIEAAERAEKAGKLADRSPFVFPAARGHGHAIGIRKAFNEVLATAKVEGVRVHDARHSFASFALADGASLFLIAKLLGHASSRTTERYAHLSADPLADAAAAVGARLMPVKPTDEGGECEAASNVVEMRPR